MFTLLMARHALLTALKSMIPPKNAAVENSLTEFAMSPHSTHRLVVVAGEVVVAVVETVIVVVAVVETVIVVVAVAAAIDVVVVAIVLVVVACVIYVGVYLERPVALRSIRSSHNSRHPVQSLILSVVFMIATETIAVVLL